MSGRNLALTLIAMLAAVRLVAPAPLVAQAIDCRLCSAPPAGSVMAVETPTTPLRIELETRLDFDRLVFDGDGDATVTLNPDGSAQITGGSGTSSRVMPGSVVVRGEPGRMVRVDLPRSIVMTGANGGQVRIDEVHSDLPSLPRIDANGNLAFRFGGKVHVSGQADGAFRGDFAITVDYM